MQAQVNIKLFYPSQGNMRNLIMVKT